MPAPAVGRLRALVNRVRQEEGGYSLVELVITMAILGTVMAAIASLFVSGISSQSDLDARFQAQVNLNTAVVKLRREAHAACGLRSGWTTSVITLNMPSSNPPPQPPDTPCTVPTTITWCTIGSGTRYALYRVAGTTCTVTNAKMYADYITSAAVFPTYTPTSVANSTLARLHIRFPIKVKASTVASPYLLDDDIVMRNSSLL
jgi:prepilin-type N-terminal cleavage/methylation domain-containing protein